MTLRYGSVCSGIEAATVAWHPLGWQPQFFSEIEAAPRAVLKHRWPEVPLHGDFTTIREGEYGAIDLLVGGTPCQSFSVAGLRGGLADDRGNLALEYLRLAQRLRPRWLVWENVPGVLSSNGGRDFGAILGGMVELGYQFAYRVLDAQYARVDGYGRAVPQRRRRVFVVGHLGDWRRCAAVLFERASLRGDTAPRREAGTAVAALTANGVGTCGADDNQGQAGHLVAHTLRGEGFDASEDGSGRGTPIVSVAFGGGNIAGPIDVGTCLTHHASRIDFDTETFIAFQQGGSNVGPTGHVSNTLTKGNGNESGGVPCIAFNSRQDPDVTWDRSGALSSSSPQAEAVAFQVSESGVRIGDVHATLDANNGPRRHNGVLQGWAVRRLTPRECERLQGFPDDHTLIPWRGGLMADGPRYKMLGNSMACNVMRWIGRRIEMVEALEAAPSLVAAE